ncbi:MAG TPA: alpha/beta hydrolase [Candidatus Limnocylindrales bacterium]|nr:alpha/beta hydrolase [Candidatus Limnocylindrales bacterium]
MTTSTAEPVTKTLDVPGATLTYDVRTSDRTTEPPLILIGSPAGAGGFASLASHFPDRTIVTFDPRNNGERSPADDPSTPITPDVQADDAHRVIEAIGGGPVDMFASSGGSIVALALVAQHPGEVRTLVAHEPPLASLVPDREHALAATRAIYDAYQANGAGAGMGKFMQVVMHGGPFTPEVVAAPGLDPAMFGMPTEDDGERNDLMLAHQMRYLVTYEPDFEALKRAPTRIVMAIGEDSNGNLAQRGGEAAAERLGSEVVRFPGDHGGFMGGEYGQPPGKPVEFAAKLREVLEQPSA